MRHNPRASQPEIGGPDRRVRESISRAAAQDDAPGLQHIDAVGDGQQGPSQGALSVANSIPPESGTSGERSRADRQGIREKASRRQGSERGGRLKSPRVVTEVSDDVTLLRVPARGLYPFAHQET